MNLYIYACCRRWVNTDIERTQTWRDMCCFRICARKLVTSSLTCCWCDTTLHYTSCVSSLANTNLYIYIYIYNLLMMLQRHRRTSHFKCFSPYIHMYILAWKRRPTDGMTRELQQQQQNAYLDFSYCSECRMQPNHVVRQFKAPLYLLNQLIFIAFFLQAIL